VIIEPEQYNNRAWPEFWLVRANVDRLWAAGIPVKQRAHVGLMHMKMLITSQIATIASSNISENWQRDHNYFLPATAKPAVHQAMRRQFEAMWNDSAAFTPLVLLPPDAPTMVAPSPGATIAPRNAALVWNRTPFATSYDVYLGLSESTLSLVASVPALLVNEPPASYSWVPQSPLRASTKYYWRIIARTFANQIASSEVWTFMTTLFDGDFNGDGIADVAVFRPSDGIWYFRYSGTGAAAGVQWGNGSDRPVRGDFDGDGKADVAVFRPSNGTWYIIRSSTGAAFGIQWGGGNDIPKPGDYDGDGKSDIAVFRPANGTWYIVNSSTGAPIGVEWGNSSDVGVPADYNGDGRIDIAVFRPSNGTWYIRYSGTGATAGVQWGNGSDIPVPGDYDGDHRTDVAVFRPSNGTWYIVNSGTGATTGVQWGNGNDIPIPGDYDGDGRTDVAVFRPSSGTWFIVNSSSGAATSVQWGNASDIPILKQP
jgi:hypothetical protein